MSPRPPICIRCESI